MCNYMVGQDVNFLAMNFICFKTFLCVRTVKAEQSIVNVPKFLNKALFLFLVKLLVIKARIHTKVERRTSREETDQTASEEAV